MRESLGFTQEVSSLEACTVQGHPCVVVALNRIEASILSIADDSSPRANCNRAFSWSWDQRLAAFQSYARTLAAQLQASKC